MYPAAQIGKSFYSESYTHSPGPFPSLKFIPALQPVQSVGRGPLQVAQWRSQEEQVFPSPE